MDNLSIIVGNKSDASDTNRQSIRQKSLIGCNLFKCIMDNCRTSFGEHATLVKKNVCYFDLTVPIVYGNLGSK